MLIQLQKENELGQGHTHFESSQIHRLAIIYYFERTNNT